MRSQISKIKALLSLYRMVFFVFAKGLPVFVQKAELSNKDLASLIMPFFQLRIDVDECFSS